MVKVCLITRPKDDLMTSYLYDFSKDIIKIAENMPGLHITNLVGKNAIRNKFESLLQKEKPRLVFLNGHGNKRCVTGHNKEVLLDENNVNLIRNKIIYALSCDSLEELGPMAIKNGTEAYIGYLAKFMFIHDPTRESTPSKDKNALPFRKACFALINSLICSIPAGDAIEITKNEYRSAIQSYGTEDDDPYGDTPLIRFALAWDLEFLGMEGNPKASF